MSYDTFTISNVVATAETLFDASHSAKLCYQVSYGQHLKVSARKSPGCEIIGGHEDWGRELVDQHY